MSGATSFTWDSAQHEGLWSKVNQVVQKRKVATTSLNAGSSRGHLVLNMTLRKVDSGGASTGSSSHSSAFGAALQAAGMQDADVHACKTRFEQAAPGSVLGSLTLVDMAGLERFDKVCTGGAARQAETCFINGSLLHLTEVFRAMRNRLPKALLQSQGANAASTGGVATPKKKRQIPFRNSNLTKLMAPAMSGSLGAGSRVVMLMTAGPAEADCDEKRSAFKQAQHALGLEIDYKQVKPRLGALQSPRGQKVRQIKRGHSAGGAITPAKTPRLRRTVSTGGSAAKAGVKGMQLHLQRMGKYTASIMGVKDEGILGAGTRSGM
jgi:hypothetical protein